jgi:hypothetical protein
MFIIPTSDVLLLALAITIVPAALQWFIDDICLGNPHVRGDEGGAANVEPGSTGRHMQAPKRREFPITFSLQEP